MSTSTGRPRTLLVVWCFALMRVRYDDASNAEYFKKHVEAAREVAAGRPIWITEFKARGSDERVKAFLDEVLPWLDASGDVHRYAYFMATTGHGFLIDNGGHSLSNIGSHYTFHS